MAEQLDMVTIGEHEYPVIKLGRAQARQVAQLSKWISRYGVKAIEDVQNKAQDATSGIEFLSSLMEALDEDALIGLFEAMTGCTREEAELYFDVATLIEVIVEVYNRQPSVQRLINRFFSAGSLKQTSGE